VTTPEPAANSIVGVGSFSSTKTSLPYPTLSPTAATSLPEGRSKFRRWTDSSPSGSPAGDGSSPFRDVVVSLLAVPRGASSPALDRHSVRCRLGSLAPRQALNIGPGDWMKVETRAAKRRRLKANRRHRPLPEDLQGRCFNCLRPGHFAVDCRRRPTCFRCGQSGHRSSACSARARPGSRPLVSGQAATRSFWERLDQAVRPRASVWDRLKKMDSEKVSVWTLEAN
jgi:hypothetical protein